MKFKTFTTSKGIYKIKSNDGLIYCKEVGYLIESDEEKYREEMVIAKLISNGYNKKITKKVIKKIQNSQIL